LGQLCHQFDGFDYRGCQVDKCGLELNIDDPAQGFELLLRLGPSLDDVSIHNRAEQPRFVAQARNLIRSTSHSHNERSETEAISDSSAIALRFQVADAVDHRVEGLLSR